MKAVLISICVTAALAGCASRPSPQPVVQTRIIDTGCDWTRTITASTADTAETKRQIIAHNDARAANCPPADK
ncbi:hypothetical protein [Paraburkholderia antibiotica]|uniref:Lipoprotein n=1 Tax=Paraburkholderia antibiotica TaxID=2728839 RepID=A0A7Y0FFS8_9BURK|nr:hypothetical protein [Paraburkholderia antibiotica]NML34501.1 hypothetical protein [Paraburkholderia antibiotica]